VGAEVLLAGASGAASREVGRPFHVRLKARRWAPVTEQQFAKAEASDLRRRLE